MTTLISINGRLSSPEQAVLPIMDRGFLYGDSVYEVIRTYSGKPFALEQHLERLKNSARMLDIKLPDIQEISDQMERTIEAAGNADSYCRIIVTRGGGPMTLDPTAATDPNIIFIVKEYEAFPDWMYEKGIRLAIPGEKRTEETHPEVKSGNYLNSVLALGQAKRQGFDDALMVNGEGKVTEGTSFNIFVMDQGTLITPPLAAGLLAGVTRSLILDIAKENQIACKEHLLSPDDFAHFEEVMATSTIREVMPVVQVGEYKIGKGTPGPMAKRLRSLFHIHNRTA